MSVNTSRVGGAAGTDDTPRDVGLRTLSRAGMTVSDPAEDVRGRKVVDRRGEEIGDVDDLVIDDRDQKVRFLLVASGGFLGIGEERFVIPVDAVAGIDENEVRIDQTRERVAGAPRYDPAVTDEPPFYGGVYGYYGYAPYWAPGYLYPAYPYFRAP